MTEKEYSDKTGGPRSSEEQRAAGHWLLAKMGKRVLRPGGLALTQELLEKAAITRSDKVVELGPGIGRTAEIVLAGQYASFTGVDPNAEAREHIRSVLDDHHDAVVREGDARATGLGDDCADVVISEAMITMQPPGDKTRIVNEIFRILTPGGRWAMHELAFRPDDVDSAVVSEVSKALARTIKVGTRPLTTKDWAGLAADAGFEIEWIGHKPMKLVDPTRIISDEGLLGALRFFNNVRRNKDARERILGMRKVFHMHKENLEAVAMIARKPTAPRAEKAG